MKILNSIKDTVRGILREIAGLLNSASAGRIRPNHITLISTLVHFVIGMAIIYGQFASAALLLAVFGLFDTLDGELARLQKSESDKGMMLDAATDRLKEIIIYSAAAYYFAELSQPYFALLAAAVLGLSLLISYIKAKSETVLALKDGSKSASQVGKSLASGLFQYEIRMAVLVLGLALYELEAALVVLAVGTLLTALGRFKNAWQTIE